MTKHNQSGAGARAARVFLFLMTLAGVLTACGGPRVKMLTNERPRPLEPNARVDVYLGEIKPPFQEVAIIETDANSYVDNEVKKRQLEQLKARARKLGANAVQNVKILSKRIKGYTIDERVPFTAWQQGQYELYFMRGTAIRVPESEPSTLVEARPAEGWIVEKMAPPPRLEPTPPAMPTLRSDAATTGTR